MTDHILTFIILCPLIAAVALLVIPASKYLAIRFIALAGAGLTLPPAIWLCTAYDRTVGGFQFSEKLDWVPSLGISYHVGVDGTSIVLVLLTAIIITGGVFASWTRPDR